jgi:lipoprotein-anchoring transpeptidase ErfK/SrfK
MGYATVLETVAERHLNNPRHLMRLNPQVDWSSIKAGTVLVVPHIGPRAMPTSRPEYILVSLGEKTLRLYDAENNLLAHFPCSIARRVEKRPVGELHVLTVAPNPDYTFRPENFPDSPEAQRIGRALKLQPGPNNPVGTAWISLSAGDGSYGIHGSPEPEQIGRTESSGCFRLANWNAEYLLQLVRAGMLVRVEP